MPDNSLATAFGAPWVVNRPGTTPLMFPMLKMRQLAELQSHMRAARLDAARRHAATQKMKPDDSTRYLTQIESGISEIGEIRAWSITPEGIVATLRLSLGKPADYPMDELDTITPDQAAEAACRATGWVPVVPDAAAPKADPQ